MTASVTLPPRIEVSQQPQRAARPEPERLAYRPDIEGLRAVAVLLVVGFHGGAAVLRGGYVGVDVFFVISGFLITSLLVVEHHNAGRVSLQDFYARRARRILPAACVVIAVSALGAVLILNPLEAFRSLGDLAGAALYVANWRFIHANLDYLAASTDHSVALHFWSLSVEEQFYLVWPLLVVVTLTLAMRIGRSIALLGIVLGMVTVGSFVLGTVLTQTDPPMAYMATFTRAWQFGLGGLLGVVALSTRGSASTGVAGRRLEGAQEPVLGRRLRWLAGWAGLVAILLSAVVYDAATPFPGYAALLPSLGAAAVIAAGVGPTAGTGEVAAVLSRAPARWFGKISYSLYLWHWPVFVLLGEHLVRSPSVPLSCGLVALSVALAALTYYCVERPFIRSPSLLRSRFRSGVVVASVLATTVGVLGVTGGGLYRTLGAATGSDSLSGAQFSEVFASSKHLKSGPVEPAPLKASADKPAPGECLSFRTTEQARDCVFGPADGVPVVLFGDSHANQWMTPFQEIAESHGWRLTVFTQGSCPPADYGVDSDLGYAGEPACVEWRAARIKEIRALHPKFVIVSSLNFYDSTPQQYATAWKKSLDELRATGAKIIYLYDTPNPQIDVPGCVSGASDDWDKCVFPLRPQQRDFVSREDKLVHDNKITYVLDLNKYLCGADLCYAVRNGVLLYRDNSHLTNTAAKLLETPIIEQLQRQGVL